MSTHTLEAHYKYTINEYNSTTHKKYLEYIFKNGDIKIIYDIGANSGATCNIFMDYINKFNNNIEKIYLFEPDIDNYNFLKKKTAKFGDIISSYNLGIFYGCNERKVFLPKDNNNEIYYTVGGFSIAPDMSNREYIETDKTFSLRTLEELNILEPDFIKIDIEGAEKNLIENSIILKKAKYILLEWQDIEDFNIIKNKYLSDYNIIFKDGDILLEKNVII
jgi:FkbM family methyltransferase